MPLAALSRHKISLENIKTGVTAATQSNDAGNFDFVNVQIGVIVRAGPGF